MDKVFLLNMGIVFRAIKSAGYSPYDQLVGYLQTGDLAYITRAGNARQIVEKMDPKMIRKYLNLVE